jgi:glycosyltransferase involved in cell wall biosynthesis
MQPKITIGVTVCNEVKELEALLEHLEDKALAPEYEIVIQIDQDNYTEEVLSVIVGKGIKHWFYPLNKDFASYKNELKKHCSGEFIFQIDADELVAPEMLELLPKIIEANPEVDLYYVPRINTVSGITQEHVHRWGWRYENERVNWPDYQTRIYRNSKDINWKNKVHEVIEGFKQFTFLPAVDELALIHPKSIERQEKQNQFYNTL